LVPSIFPLRTQKTLNITGLANSMIYLLCRFGLSRRMGRNIFPQKTQKTQNVSGMVVSVQVYATSSRLEYSENLNLTGF